MPRAAALPAHRVTTLCIYGMPSRSDMYSHQPQLTWTRAPSAARTRRTIIWCARRCTHFADLCRTRMRQPTAWPSVGTALASTRVRRSDAMMFDGRRVQEYRARVPHCSARPTLRRAPHAQCDCQCVHRASAHVSREAGGPARHHILLCICARRQHIRVRVVLQVCWVSAFDPSSTSHHAACTTSAPAQPMPLPPRPRASRTCSSHRTGWVHV